MNRFPALLATIGIVLMGCGKDVTVPVDDSGDATVTYYEDVAPIIYDNCLPCHEPEGIAPVPLTTYEETKDAAWMVADQTAQGLMPPWPPGDASACHPLRHSRAISETEKDILMAWHNADTPAGDPTAGPPQPEPALGLAEVSATLDIGSPYLPNADVADDYRCFVVDPGLTDDMFVTAHEVKPGDSRVVHHVILYSLDSDEAELEAQALDAADEGPGYTCYGGVRVYDSRFILSWAPGLAASQFPPETGVRLDGGRKAVIQVHYNLSNGAYESFTEIDLTLASDVAYPATIELFLNKQLEIPPGQESVVVNGEQENPANKSVRLWGNAPHMHELGAAIKVNAQRASEDICLMDIPKWDFNWQQMYFYETPIIIEPDDTLKLSCEYSSVGKMTTTTWGEGTEDEMCLNIFYVTP